MIPTPSNSDATYTIKEKGGAVIANDSNITTGVGRKTYEVVITATDRQAMATYEAVITVKSASMDATLKDLVFNAESSSESKNLISENTPGTVTFSESVGSSDSYVTVKPALSDLADGFSSFTITTTYTNDGKVFRREHEAGAPIPTDFGTTEIYITVTASNKAMPMIYTVTVERLKIPEPPLIGLTLVAKNSEGDPVSDGATLVSSSLPLSKSGGIVQIKLRAKVRHILVTAEVPEGATAKIPMPVGDPIDVTSGRATVAVDPREDDSFDIVITPPADAAVVTYSLTWDANTTVSSEANLVAMTFADSANAQLTPAIEPDILTYEVSVANTEAALDITPKFSPGAIAKIVAGTVVASTGVVFARPETPVAVDFATPTRFLLAVGMNSIQFVVTPENGGMAMKKTYMLEVTRAKAAASTGVAALVGLQLSAGALDAPFDSLTISYNVAVLAEVASLIVTPTVKDGNAVTLEATKIISAAPDFDLGTSCYSTTPPPLTVMTVPSGQPSGHICLSPGRPAANTFTITVTSSDASSERTYTVKASRAASLKGVTVVVAGGSGTIKPDLSVDFMRDTLNYQLTASSGITEAAFTFTVRSGETLVAGIGTTTPSSVMLTPVAAVAPALTSATQTGTETVSLTIGATATSSITVVVTSAGTTNTKVSRTYTFAILREVPVALSLSALVVTPAIGVTLTPTFNGNMSSYEVTAASAVGSVVFAPTLAEKTSSWTISEGGSVLKKAADVRSSQAIKLEGATTRIVTITVSTAGVSPIHAYVFTITRLGVTVTDVRNTLAVALVQSAARYANDVIAKRIESAAGLGPTARASLGGQSSLATALASNMQSIVDGTLSVEEALGNSSFVLPLQEISAAGGISSDGVSIWGGSDYSRLDPSPSPTVSWDGSRFSLHLGVDTRPSEQSLAGVLLAWSKARGNWKSLLANDAAATASKYDFDLSSVHPYAGWQAADRSLRVWGSFGVGSGGLEVAHHAHQDGDPSFKIGMNTLAAGANGTIWEDPATGIVLKVKADYQVTKATVEAAEGVAVTLTQIDGGKLSVSTGRLRLGLEVGRDLRTKAGMELHGGLETTISHDDGGGYGAEGDGFEIVARVRASKPATGLQMEADARYMMIGGSFDEWGVRGQFALRTGQDGTGLFASLQPTYGNTVEAGDSIWEHGLRSTNSAARVDPEGRLEAEFGYGFAVANQGGVLSPYSMVTLREESQSYGLGMRWALGAWHELNLSGRRSIERRPETVEDQLLLEGNLRF